MRWYDFLIFRWRIFLGYPLTYIFLARFLIRYLKTDSMENRPMMPLIQAPTSGWRGVHGKRVHESSQENNKTFVHVQTQCLHLRLKNLQRHAKLGWHDAAHTGAHTRLVTLCGAHTHSLWGTYTRTEYVPHRASNLREIRFLTHIHNSIYIHNSTSFG